METIKCTECGKDANHIETESYNNGTVVINYHRCTECGEIIETYQEMIDKI